METKLGLPVRLPLRLPLGLPLGLPVEMPLGLPLGMPVGLPLRLSLANGAAWRPDFGEPPNATTVGKSINGPEANLPAAYKIVGHLISEWWAPK